ncbi:2-isopropylmalate synthase [Catenisphaera adipataccumulans]|jgi:2-isopropylmalate synthase|uniref:2-isopropylmalate synthase n=1 Tax=Catenisphaera adipataccumulans TaxID=700500 RepID=A0A7W8CX57_9FIRM|nr:2-isopropylmalate synthase [Catenisphaera adipataccumulans]MBB5183246.1 2-isopropylmalate synthase [Catenisphaera adipataccumulans]
MMNNKKYHRGYFMPPEPSYDWVKKEYIDHAPTWCSVDLRDGNQALVIPMSLEEKLEFFKVLVDIGFKEIEVGFPAASETEFEFLRTLIEQDLIPDDVTVQVLTQARDHIIRKTFDSLKGCKNAVVHFYNSTSLAQREQVFKKSKEEIMKIATDGAKLVKQLSDEAGADYKFEYSPESFTGTEIDYALDVCNAVIDIFQPTPEKPLIINLPATVEMSLPHIYAQQIEYMSKHMNRRDSIILSVHPHNDRGTGVAITELALLAGADRVEGTLFGNGERTGNVDLVTVALNMYTHGVDPKLDFSHLPQIAEVYERVTRMKIYERQPYSGKLVFAAFSGSHQDAIAKGMHYRDDHHTDDWTVPYLPIDPTDIGRVYESDVIRINSQSGKGGIGFIMEQNFGYKLPKVFREQFSYYIKEISDHKHKELKPEEIFDVFNHEFVNLNAPIRLVDYHFVRGEKILVTLTINFRGEEMDITGRGNGRLDAVANALRKGCNLTFDVVDYNESSLSKGSTSKAVSYVQINDCIREDRFGVGVDDDIMASSIKALISSINRAIIHKED